MQIKTRHHFTPTRLAKIKCEHTKHWPVREKWLLSYSADDNPQPKMYTLHDPAHAQDGQFKDVHCGIVITQQWETTLMSIKEGMDK